MTSHSAYFAADLSSLLAIGVLDLPDRAETYDNLAKKVHGTAGSDAQAFAAYPSDAEGGRSATNRVYSTWTELRDLAFHALHDSAAHCTQAADAIIKIVHMYAENETKSGKILRQIWAHGLPSQFTNTTTRDGKPDRLPSSSPLHGEGRLEDNS